MTDIFENIFTSFDLRIVTPITHDAVAIPINASRNENLNKTKRFLFIIYREKVIVVRLYQV